MNALIVITGTTDGYGLKDLREALVKHCRPRGEHADRLGLLSTWGNMPSGFYHVQLADDDSHLSLVRIDPRGDKWQFVITVATDSRVFVDKMVQAFVGPTASVSFKDVVTIVPGERLVTAEPVA